MRAGPNVWLLILALLLHGINPGDVQAEGRRALLIGINTYVPANSSASNSKPNAARTEYSNLIGCVNDVETMREILMAKFQFQSLDIHVLLESQAKRAEILGEIQKQLIDNTAPGDICLFFYAGHGSLVRNLKSNKPSGMDSALVPADSCEGAMDIRDKELARLFNKALDRGVLLTAIFDSCYSGSIARGLPSQFVSRNLPPEPRTVSDPSDPGKTPEERGALILSAAQDYQSASEWHDDNFTPHGAFTVALLKALESTPPNAPSEQLFLSAQIMLQAEISGQIPVLAGNSERRQKPFLGIGTGSASGLTTVAADSCDFDTGLIRLRGGQAIGLQPGCELQKLPRTGKGSSPGISIRVTKVVGFTKVIAEVTSGNFRNVRSGDLFEVTRWVYPSAASLRVWIPPTGFTMADLKRLAPELESLRSSDQIQWVDDPTELTPSNVLSWSASGWTLSGLGNLGKKWKAQDVLQKLAGLKGGKSKLFVSLPPPRELAQEFQFGDNSPNSSVATVRSSSDALYYLAGHWNESKTEYCWIRPNVTNQDTMETNPLPVRTDWLAIGNNDNSSRNTARQLEDKAARIGRLKAWLALQAHGSDNYFPYHLALRNTANGQTKGFGDIVLDGESYGLVLLADPGAQLDKVPRQWVYVLASDSWGKIQLIFPPVFQGNIGNCVPYKRTDQNQQTAPREIVLGNPADPTLFTVGPPYGIDTYVLLTTAETMPEPSALESEGLRTRGALVENPLQALLGNLGSRLRGADPVVPADWAIQRTFIRSLPK
jgi:Caspase domain